MNPKSKDYLTTTLLTNAYLNIFINDTVMDKEKENTHLVGNVNNYSILNI